MPAISTQHGRERMGVHFAQPLLITPPWLSRVRLSATPWTAARQASLSFTISRSLLKLMSIESVMPSNHLILCGPLLLPPSIFPSVRIINLVRSCKVSILLTVIQPSLFAMACELHTQSVHSRTKPTVTENEPKRSHGSQPCVTQ